MYTSLHRPMERPTSNWSAGSWVLALCLAWLWTCPASASLQPPTSAGLGKVVRRGKGFLQDAWRARRHSSPSHKAGRSLGQSKICRCDSSSHYPGNCPLPVPSLEKAWEDPLAPSLPRGRCSAVRPSGGGLSLVSWPNSGVFLLEWLKPL